MLNSRRVKPLDTLCVSTLCIYFFLLLTTKYWFELLTPDYKSYECYIPYGTVAKARRYALQYMRENGISEALLVRNSLTTSNILKPEVLYVGQ